MRMACLMEECILGSCKTSSSKSIHFNCLPVKLVNIPSHLLIISHLEGCVQAEFSLMLLMIVGHLNL